MKMVIKPCMWSTEILRCMVATMIVLRATKTFNLPCMPREAATNGDRTNLEEYTSSVTSYISKCIDDVTVSKA